MLAGTLVIPDGVPSQAGLLAANAPWRGAVPVQPADPQLLDVTHQVEPWLLYLRHELRAGRLPFWDPHQFAGEPFWSNGSSAVLFPLHLLFAALPIRWGLLLLPWLRLAVGGCGAAALARRLGVGRQAALVAAVAYPLSGMVVSFLLFPMGNTHALLPWVLWAVERIAAGNGSWSALAIAGGLQLLGGHPETPVFTALLAALYLLARGGGDPAAPSRLPWRVWGHFLIGWTVAGALSAVQNAPLLVTAMDSSKWLHWQAPTPIPWAVRGTLLLRALLPHPFGSASDGSWWGPFNDPATAIYCGAAALPLAITSLPWLRRDARWRGVVVLTLGALLGAYHFPVAKQILLALPLVRHGLHHYLKIGLELGLALLAAGGWQRWLDGARRGLAAGAVATLALLALAAATLATAWSRHQQMQAQLPWLLFAAAVGITLLLLSRLPPRARPALAWLAPVLLVGDLAAAHRDVNPAVSAATLYPSTPAVELLRGRSGRVAATGSTLRPDAAMVYGLDDVRGDSPVKLERYERLYATLAAPDPVFFQPLRRWHDPWLDLLAVRWVMTAPGEPSADPSWRLVFDGSDARVYERATAQPEVRWEQAGQPPPVVLAATPGYWRVRWRTQRPARLVVAETWDEGWRASIGDRVLPVLPWRGVLMVVPLPAGGGIVALRYRPTGLTAGLTISLLALVVCAAPALVSRLPSYTGRAAR